MLHKKTHTKEWQQHLDNNKRIKNVYTSNVTLYFLCFCRRGLLFPIHDICAIWHWVGVVLYKLSAASWWHDGNTTRPLSLSTNWSAMLEARCFLTHIYLINLVFTILSIDIKDFTRSSFHIWTWQNMHFSHLYSIISRMSPQCRKTSTSTPTDTKSKCYLCGFKTCFSLWLLKIYNIETHYTEIIRWHFTKKLVGTYIKFLEMVKCTLPERVKVSNYISIMKL